MNEMQTLRPLWRELKKSGEEFVLATVVAVEGSGYRKAGARLLIANDGRRAGTISGGCLEAEVAKKALWHTENGPVVRSYSTRAEDGDVPFGMGCGGVVHVLLERRETAEPLLEAMERAYALRLGMAVATRVSGDRLGERSWRLLNERGQADYAGSECAELRARVDETQTRKRSESTDAVFAEWMAARTGLLIVGAGNDTRPLARVAHELGWEVTVMDGRSHLATRERFPEADAVLPLNEQALRGLKLRATDAAALMSHSLEQDRMALGELLGRELAYLGVLGPRARTAEMVMELAEEKARGEEAARRLAAEWMARLHAPMGLELGGDGAEAVALSVLAEMQKTLNAGSGRALREVRGDVGTQAFAAARA